MNISEHEKLDQAAEMLLQIGKGNFDARIAIDNNDDSLNTVLSGLNMVAEELRYYKQELNAKTSEQERLIKELNNKYNELMQFSYIVSHNLRAPVASILGTISLLQDTTDEEEKAEIQKLVSASAESLDNLLKDLSTILSTKSQLNEKFEEVNLPAVLDEVQSFLDMAIRDNNVKLIINIEPGADKIKSIKSYIQSALYNLISNSIKYSKATVSPVITIDISKKQDIFSLKVADNGIGIDLEKHGGEIFGLYKRFNVDLEGKGLGLHMTKLQMEAIGGTIKVSSKPGEGTSFTIMLKEPQAAGGK